MPLRAFLFSLFDNKEEVGVSQFTESQCPCGRFCFLSHLNPQLIPRRL